MKKVDLKLSSTSRKALCVQVGETAGSEIANLLQVLSERVDQLERSKVSVTHVAPANSVNLMPKLVDNLS
jgi:hypothetical protein